MERSNGQPLSARKCGRRRGMSLSKRSLFFFPSSETKAMTNPPLLQDMPSDPCLHPDHREPMVDEVRAQKDEVGSYAAMLFRL